MNLLCQEGRQAFELVDGLGKQCFRIHDELGSVSELYIRTVRPWIQAAGTGPGASAGCGILAGTARAGARVREGEGGPMSRMPICP